MSDVEDYDYEPAPERAAPTSLAGMIAARLGRPVNRSRTDNRRFSLFMTVVNDNRRSVFGGREKRRRWE